MSIGRKLIHVRVNDKLHKSLNQRAKDTNRTVSQYIRDILSTSTHPLEIGLPVTIPEAQEDMKKHADCTCRRCRQIRRQVQTVKQQIQEEYGI